jgi:hypothetical protein
LISCWKKIDKTQVVEVYKHHLFDHFHKKQIFNPPIKKGSIKLYWNSIWRFDKINDFNFIEGDVVPWSCSSVTSFQENPVFINWIVTIK